MRRCIWNRFTVVGVIGIFAGLLCLVLFLGRGGEGGLYEILIYPAFIFITGSLAVEGYTFYKSRHFFREDALDIYSKIAVVIKELREIGPVIHHDIDHLLDPNGAFRRDK